MDKSYALFYHRMIESAFSNYGVLPKVIQLFRKVEWKIPRSVLYLVPQRLFFFYQPSSVRGWTSAFLLAVHRLCGVIEGRLSHFLPRWLKTGWQSVISQGKIP